MHLREILASTCRQRILEALARVDETHMMELVRKTNSTYKQIDRNLKILVKENLVSIRRLGRIKAIQLSRESERTRTLLKALYTLNRPIHNSENG